MSWHCPQCKHLNSDHDFSCEICFYEMGENKVAKKDLKVTASVEKIIHNSLRTTLEQLANDYGIMINSVNIDWLDLSDNANFKVQVSTLRMDTTTTSLK